MGDDGWSLRGVASSLCFQYSHIQRFMILSFACISFIFVFEWVVLSPLPIFLEFYKDLKDNLRNLRRLSSKFVFLSALFLHKTFYFHHNWIMYSIMICCLGCLHWWGDDHKFVSKLYVIWGHKSNTGEWNPWHFQRLRLYYWT